MRPMAALPADATTQAAAAAAMRRTFVRYMREGPPPRIRVIPGSDPAVPPPVTVIIPTADGTRGGNLGRLLDDLRRQTFARFEIVVVEGDRRQGRAINTAAAIARGDILVTMDDDTRLGHDDLLERITGVFSADPSIGIAGVSNVTPPDASWIVRRAMRELPRRSSKLVDTVTDSDMAEHPCLAIRKDVFYRIGGEHEWIPRGLDPYLRQEVRRIGYRVVVTPHAWIHHLLPSTLRGILRQYFRNGVGAAYVARFYPEFVIDQTLDHRARPRAAGSRLTRAVRYLGRFAGAVVTMQWIYLATLASYAAGYVWGMRRLREDSL
ncbi:MAG TPA: glycosyltransferase [bacterium]|nr:glycosyltransferase [bacterium]